jgi:hypothetical protein
LGEFARLERLVPRQVGEREVVGVGERRFLLGVDDEDVRSPSTEAISRALYVLPAPAGPDSISRAFNEGGRLVSR